ncbi:MAG: DUF1559 domain-containing protein [Planctomycetes bacterium]|nr:DUF1559 domain-containing protein [Planctomycetota bacterium]
MAGKRPGFSITELVVILVVTAAALALAIMALNRGRRVHGNVQHLNNLKQLSLAAHSCNDVFRKLPPAYGKLGAPPVPGNYSVHFHLMLFVEADNVYRTAKTDAAVWAFKASADPSTSDDRGVQNFAANLRVFSDKGLSTPYNADIDFGDPLFSDTWDSGNGTARIPTTFEPRGTSYVIIFSTRFANNTARRFYPGAPTCSSYSGKPYHDDGAFFGSKAALGFARSETSNTPTFQTAPFPVSVNCAYSAFSHSFRPDLIDVALADASVRSISAEISPETWNRAMQPNCELKPDADWEN